MNEYTLKWLETSGFFDVNVKFFNLFFDAAKVVHCDSNCYTARKNNGVVNKNIFSIKDMMSIFEGAEFGDCHSCASSLTFTTINNLSVRAYYDFTHFTLPKLKNFNVLFGVDGARFKPDDYNVIFEGVTLLSKLFGNIDWAINSMTYFEGVDFLSSFCSFNLKHLNDFKFNIKLLTESSLFVSAVNNFYDDVLQSKDVSDLKMFNKQYCNFANALLKETTINERFDVNGVPLRAGDGSVFTGFVNGFSSKWGFETNMVMFSANNSISATNPVLLRFATRLKHGGNFSLFILPVPAFCFVLENSFSMTSPFIQESVLLKDPSDSIIETMKVLFVFDGFPYDGLTLNEIFEIASTV